MSDTNIISAGIFYALVVLTIVFTLLDYRDPTSILSEVVIIVMLAFAGIVLNLKEFGDKVLNKRENE